MVPALDPAAAQKAPLEMLPPLGVEVLPQSAQEEMTHSNSSGPYRKSYGRLTSTSSGSRRNLRGSVFSRRSRPRAFHSSVPVPPCSRISFCRATRLALSSSLCRLPEFLVGVLYG